MNDDVLVKVDNVSKRFCRSLKRSLWYGLQDLGSEIGGHRHGGWSGLPQSSADVQLRPDEFWAVKDVSFELRRGESLGLIGRNGAGKTTLLRMLNGLIKPDTGSISMCGEVGSVIALGAGFNPVLTGRENIYTSCSVLGLGQKETTKRLEEIIEFSELGEFIDSPIQSYSSGMQVRLGFAVATTQQPDILILDEVLAVGDAQFRSKCYQKIDSMRKNTALVFVSHAMDQVARLCNKGIMLRRESSAKLSSVEDAVCEYESANESCEAGFTDVQEPLTHFGVTVGSESIRSGSRFRFKIIVSSSTCLDGCKIRAIAYNCFGSPCAESGLIPLSLLGLEEIKNGLNEIELTATAPLKAGLYQLSFNILSSTGEQLVWSHKVSVINVYSNFYANLDCVLALEPAGIRLTDA